MQQLPWAAYLLAAPMWFGEVLVPAPDGPGTPPAARADEPLYKGKPLSHWVGLLKEEDALDREEAVEVIAGAGPAAKAALPALAGLLKDASPPVRFKAAVAVWKVGRQGKEAAPALVEVLKDPRNGSRLLAAQTAAEIGPDAKDTAPHLVTALADKDPRLRRRAAEALEQLGADAAPALAAGLGHGEASVRRLCAAVLGRLPPAAAKAAGPALTTALDDRDGQVRVAAAVALWRLGRRGDDAVPALVELVADPDKNVRQEAAGQLCWITPRPKEAARGFAALLKDPDPFLRVQGAAGLWDMHQDVDEVRPALLAVLKDPALGFARVRALELAVRMGPEAKLALPVLLDELGSSGANRLPIGDAVSRIGADAVPPLVERLKGKDFNTTMMAGFGLAAVGAESVAPLRKLLDHPDAHVRLTVVRSLGHIGPDARAAAPAVADAIRGDKDPGVRITAAQSLGLIGPDAREAATPALLAALKDKDAVLRSAALIALRQVRAEGNELSAALDEAAKDSDGNVRYWAIDLRWRLDGNDRRAVAALAEMLKEKPMRPAAMAGLGRFGDRAGADPAVAAALKGAVPRMAEALKDPNPLARRHAARDLSRLGPLAKEALPALAEALADKDPDTRIAAADAIQALGGDGKSVAEALLNDLKAADFTAALRANEALRRFGPGAKAAVPALRELLKDQLPDRRTVAAETLYAVDPAQREVGVQVLLESLPSSSGFSRVRVALALCRLDGVKPRYLDALTVCLTDADWGVRHEAVLALAHIGPDAKAALPALESVLGDEMPYNRLHAARALWKVSGRPQPAVVALAAATKDPTSAELRRQAAELLAEMGPDGKGAVPALAAALRETNPTVRAAAAEALQKINPQAAAKAGAPR